MAGTVMLRPLVVAAMLMLVTVQVRAQEPARDSINCDSVVTASRADTARTGLYVVAGRVDGSTMNEDQARAIATSVATMFTPPKPFRISVFSGPAQMSTFRRVTADTAVELRAPSVTGVYRFLVKKDSSALTPRVVRASLIPGFDAAATLAIASIAPLRDVMAPPLDEDSMTVEVRFASDSTRNAVRIIEAVFPRMPIVDAVPKPDNPRPAFPESEKGDMLRVGEVVLRFVVDRVGAPALETIEIVRGTSIAFIRSALAVLPEQRFTPARIKGCAVAQTVYYAFSFVLPDGGKIPFRH